MRNGRAIIESSTYEGVLYLIESIKGEFPTVWWTEPVKCPEGKFLSSVHYSDEIITITEGAHVDRL